MKIMVYIATQLFTIANGERFYPVESDETLIILGFQTQKQRRLPKRTLINIGLNASPLSSLADGRKGSHLKGDFGELKFIRKSSSEYGKIVHSNANINQNVVRIRFNKSLITPQYLSCFLNSKIARFQIDSLFTGNTYPILTYPKIKSFRIFIPKGNIEKNVTTALIEANRLHIQSFKLIKNARKRLLASLNVNFSRISEKKFYALNYKVIHDEDMLTPAYYYPQYRNYTKMIAKRNKVKRLGDIVDFRKGNEIGSANYKSFLESTVSCIPFVRTSDIINYDVDLQGDYYIDKSIYDDLKQNIKPNEIVFTKDGSIGKVAFITTQDKFLLSSGFLRIRTHSINPYYLFVALSLPYIGLYQALQRTVVATTIPHMREDLAGDIEIPVINKDALIIKNTEKAFVLRDTRKRLIAEIKSTIEQAFEKL